MLHSKNPLTTSLTQFYLFCEKRKKSIVLNASKMLSIKFFSFLSANVYKNKKSRLETILELFKKKKNLS